MPSIEHEAAVQILHADPQLAAILLGSCGVPLPSGAIPVTADSNLSDRDPTDLRSDNVLIFEGIGGKVAVIAEVQKDKRDVGRMLVARLRLQCPSGARLRRDLARARP
jgi:hypothetical protein